MPQFLYTVTDVFDISGRGIVAVPGIPPETEGIRKGTPLELRRPDGSVLLSRVHSVAMVSPYDPKRPIQFPFHPTSPSRMFLSAPRFGSPTARPQPDTTLQRQRQQRQGASRFVSLRADPLGFRRRLPFDAGDRDRQHDNLMRPRLVGQETGMYDLMVFFSIEPPETRSGSDPG